MNLIRALTPCWLFVVLFSACDQQRLQPIQVEPVSSEVDGGVNGAVDGGLVTAPDAGVIPRDGGSWSPNDGGLIESPFFVGDADLGPATPTAWVRTLIAASNMFVTDVIIDASGDVLATGMTMGDTDFGVGLVYSPTWSPFLVKYAANGKLRWGRVFRGWFANASGPHSPRVAVGADGAIMMAGAYRGPLDLGAGPLPCDASSFDFFVASFNADGTTRWSKGFPAPEIQEAVAVAVDSHGAVWVAGNFVGTMKLESHTVSAPGNKGQVFLAKFANDGQVLHTFSWGDAQSQQAFSLTALSDDSVVFGGGSSGTIDIAPAGQVVSSDQNAFDAVLIRVSADGVPLWGHSYGTAGRQAVLSVRPDGQGGVFAYGIFSGTLTGLGDLVATETSDNEGVNHFLARVDGNGMTTWSRGVPEKRNLNGVLDLISVDSTGNVLLPLKTTLFDLSLRTFSPSNELLSNEPFTLMGEVLSTSLGEHGLAFGGTAIGSSMIFGIQPTAGGTYFIAHLPR